MARSPPQNAKIEMEKVTNRRGAAPRLHVAQHDVRCPRRRDRLAVEHRVEHHAADRLICLELRGGVRAAARPDRRRWRLGQPPLPVLRDLEA